MRCSENAVVVVVVPAAVVFHSLIQYLLAARGFLLELVDSEEEGNEEDPSRDT